MVKLYPREGYDKTEYLSKKVRGVIDLIRPFTLLAPAVGGVSAGLIGLAAANDYTLSATLIINNMTALAWGVSTLVLINAASNALNAAYDAEIDMVNKPYRPVQIGRASCREKCRSRWSPYH